MLIPLLSGMSPLAPDSDTDTCLARAGVLTGSQVDRAETRNGHVSPSSIPIRQSRMGDRA